MKPSTPEAIKKPLFEIDEVIANTGYGHIAIREMLSLSLDLSQRFPNQLHLDHWQIRLLRNNLDLLIQMFDRQQQ